MCARVWGPVGKGRILWYMGTDVVVDFNFQWTRKLFFEKARVNALMPMGLWLNNYASTFVQSLSSNWPALVTLCKDVTSDVLTSFHVVISHFFVEPVTRFIYTEQLSKKASNNMEEAVFGSEK